MPDAATEAAPPALPLQSLTDLRAFVAVVDCGSFSRAAAEVGLSQPTVSQRVQALEQHCGLRLLDRRNGIALTSAGRLLYVRARQVLSAAQGFDAAARGGALLRDGRLVIGYASPHLTMAPAAAFLERHPGVSVAFRYGNTATLLADLEAFRVDVAILTVLTPSPAYAACLLARQRPVLCVARTHPWAERGGVSLRDVAGQPVVTREEGSTTRQTFEAACATAGVTPGRVLEVATREAVKEAAAVGLGVGIVLEKEAGDDSRLAILRLEDCAVEAGTYALALREARPLATVDAFFSVCEELYRPA